MSGRSVPLPVAGAMSIRLVVNGQAYERQVEPRRLLSDVIRDDLGLTGTHVGCEHGICGACTVLIDGASARACLLFAVQANGRSIETVEGLAKSPTELHPLQQAFWECHGLQCGYCTPGFLMTLVEFLRETPDPTEDDVREAISGNLCRCTGYQNIVEATLRAAPLMRAEATGAGTGVDDYGAGAGVDDYDAGSGVDDRDADGDGGAGDGDDAGGANR